MERLAASEVAAPPHVADATPSHLLLTIGLGTVITSILIFIASGDAWRLPWQYGDDLIFDLASWSYREEKLPGEARWIVWLWHEVAGGASPATNFRLGVIAWSGAMTLLASRLTGGGRAATVICGAALAASPGALRLLQWPHTAVPMLITVLLGALLLVAGSATARQLALAVAVAAGAAMLAFQLFALLLIAAALLSLATRAARTPTWNPRQLLRDALLVGASGVAGATAGLLTGYALNHAAFGHFGLEIASWRLDDFPATSRPALAMHNLAALLRAVSAFSAHLIGPIALAATGVWTVLAMRRPAGSRMVALVLAIVAGVVAAPATVALLSGASAPTDRGSVTIWFAAITALVLLADVGEARKRRFAYGAMVLLGAISLWRSGSFLAERSELRQQQDGHLEHIERTVRAHAQVSGPIRALVAIGNAHPFDLPATDDGWWVRALLSARLEPHLVRTVAYCAGLPCAAAGDALASDELSRMPAYPDSGYLERRGDAVLLRFPDR